MTTGLLAKKVGMTQIFNAVGDTIAVAAVPESFLQELTDNEILHIRSLAG